jgi:soluble lytic murein transglycosylase-like protein
MACLLLAGGADAGCVARPARPASPRALALARSPLSPSGTADATAETAGGASVVGPDAARAAPFMGFVREAESATGLPPDLILAVVYVESRFKPEARSSAGAQGLMQLMPGTATALAVRLGLDADPYDPRFSILAGSHYLAQLLHAFDGDLGLALAAYNAGPARVARWHEAGAAMPDYSRRYVDAVLAARVRFGGPLPPAADGEVLDASALASLLRDAPPWYELPPPPDDPAPPESVPTSLPTAPASAPASPD